MDSNCPSTKSRGLNDVFVMVSVEERKKYQPGSRKSSKGAQEIGIRAFEWPDPKGLAQIQLCQPHFCREYLPIYP
jgi:hypothetical protein